MAQRGVQVVEILSKIFIKDRKNYSDPHVRYSYGILCSVLAVALNILLGALKFVAGLLTGSISVMADAVNNFADAISAVLTFLGFKLSAKKPDREHPFGHGRIEYVTGLVVSAAIILVGFEALKEAVVSIIEHIKFHISPEKFSAPETIEFSYLAVGILCASILVKIYMALFMKSVGKKINSSAMKATGSDALGDTVATSIALLCMLIYKLWGVDLDAYAGLIVSAFIIKVGIDSIKETLRKLLGTTADKEVVENIKKTVFSYPDVVGIHDMIVHDYGPGRCMVSLHAEFDGSKDIYLIHDMIDRLSDELSLKFGCEAVVHMDPIDLTDETVIELRALVEKCAGEISDSLSIHDLRVVPGVTHTNIIFDMLVPLDFKIGDEELTKLLRAKVKEQRPDCNLVIQIDRPYI